jgi:E3 ubiquitin-protein ligase BRE1
MDQTVQVLTHQNQRLAVQLEEKRRDNRILEDKVAEYESKEAEYSQTLLSVNRLWEQLQSDLQHLAAAACASDADGADEGKAGEAASNSGRPTASSSSDPFLARLLCGTVPAATTKAVADGQRQLNGSRTEVEEALGERAVRTQQALSSVLEALRAAQKGREALAQQLADGSGDEALKQEHARLAQEVAAMRMRADHSYSEHRTRMEQLQLSSDRLLEAEGRIKKLENELADNEQQLSSFHRKYAALKEGQAAGLEHQQSLPLKQEPGQAGGAGAGPSGAAGMEPAEAAARGVGLQEELQQLQALMDKRCAELEKEKESHNRTKR